MTDENVTEEAKETSELEKAIAILEPLIEENKTEEEMVVALIQAGYRFAKAGRLLSRALESTGARLSSKDRYESVSELLSTWKFEATSWDDLQATVESLVHEVSPSTEGQIFSCIKRYAKINGFELPEKPALRLANDFNSRFMDWALANRDATIEDIRGFVVASNAKPNQVDKYVDRCGFMLDFARKFAVVA